MAVWWAHQVSSPYRMQLQSVSRASTLSVHGRRYIPQLCTISAVVSAARSMASCLATFRQSLSPTTWSSPLPMQQLWRLPRCSARARSRHTLRSVATHGSTTSTHRQALYAVSHRQASGARTSTHSTHRASLTSTARVTHGSIHGLCHRTSTSSLSASVAWRIPLSVSTASSPPIQRWRVRM